MQVDNETLKKSASGPEELAASDDAPPGIAWHLIVELCSLWHPAACSVRDFLQCQAYEAMSMSHACRGRSRRRLAGRKKSGQPFAAACLGCCWQFALGCIVVPARAFLSYLVTILYFKH